VIIKFAIVIKTLFVQRPFFCIVKSIHNLPFRAIKKEPPIVSSDSLGVLFIRYYIVSALSSHHLIHSLMLEINSLSLLVLNRIFSNWVSDAIDCNCNIRTSAFPSIVLSLNILTLLRCSFRYIYFLSHSLETLLQL